MAELERPLAAVDDARAAESPETAETPETTGFLLHGVVGVRGHERALAKLAISDDDQLIEHEGLAALVRVVPYRLPEWETEQIREHSRRVERAMRRCTIVPAPYGIVFRSDHEVVTFLKNQHLALTEALSFLDGAFEMRLHIRSSGKRPDLSEGRQADRVAEFYKALRRRSRAAFPLEPQEPDILSAAFLVDRAEWVSFVEHADELDHQYPEFQFDLTGPWPPYDFVRMSFFPDEILEE